MSFVTMPDVRSGALQDVSGANPHFHGPTVSVNTTRLTFRVDFSKTSPDWFAGEAGAKNKIRLCALLEKFIEDIQGDVK